MINDKLSSKRFIIIGVFDDGANRANRANEANGTNRAYAAYRWCKGSKNNRDAAKGYVSICFDGVSSLQAEAYTDNNYFFTTFSVLTVPSVMVFFMRTTP